jgi:hypothetical protein
MYNGYQLELERYRPLDMALEARSWDLFDLLLEAISVLWILNTGAQWHFLPQCYPNYKTVHRRFQQWCQQEVLRMDFPGVNGHCLVVVRTWEDV